ncbi:hypothetical protein GBAR_LOCUS4946 [Geodia barretti]|uniref:Uncharacterized protein n=1 Tax=Geodia barretti TaxID=519541 RepID=A0AA35RAM7_GEOBA|nr:hypothetical protein GBAR_LOCUS4946 [Geodia barretti]
MSVISVTIYRRSVIITIVYSEVKKPMHQIHSYCQVTRSPHNCQGTTR